MLTCKGKKMFPSPQVSDRSFAENAPNGGPIGCCRSAAPFQARNSQALAANRKCRFRSVKVPLSQGRNGTFISPANSEHFFAGQQTFHRQATTDKKPRPSQSSAGASPFIYQHHADAAEFRFYLTITLTVEPSDILTMFRPRCGALMRRPSTV